MAKTRDDLAQTRAAEAAELVAALEQENARLRGHQVRVLDVERYIADLERENELLQARIDELIGFAGHELDQARYKHLLALVRDHLAHKGVTFMDLVRFVRENFK